MLSSDDPVRPSWLAAPVALMGAHPEVVVGYPDWDTIDAESRVIRSMTTFEDAFESMLSRFHTFPGPGALIRRVCPPRVGARSWGSRGPACANAPERAATSRRVS